MWIFTHIFYGIFHTNRKMKNEKGDVIGYFYSHALKRYVRIYEDGTQEVIDRRKKIIRNTEI